MIHCDRAMYKHGKDRQNFQRWRCPVCGLTLSDNPAPSKAGRKPTGNAKSSTERSRTHRARKSTSSEPVDDDNV